MQGGLGESRRLKWHIRGFTTCAQQKKRVYSKHFSVHTVEGVYRFQLFLNFFRKRGSTTSGYVGFFIKNVVLSSEENFPVSVQGTDFSVTAGAR